MSLRDRVNAFMNPNAQRHVVTPQGSFGGKFPAHALSGTSLRRRSTMTEHGSIMRPDEQFPKRGMWVRFQNRTGILTNLEAGDIATVMMVDPEQGTNVMEVHAPGSQLRQAFYEEIPTERRPKFADAVRFGYHRKPA